MSEHRPPTSTVPGQERIARVVPDGPGPMGALLGAIVAATPPGWPQPGVGSIIFDTAQAPAAPPNDANNPNRALRSRPLLGIAVLSGFARNGSGDFQGTAYDPKSGRSYRSYLSLNADGTLRVTGCVTFICRSQTWRRVR